MKISRFRSWDLKSAKLKCHKKYLFSLTSKLKCFKKKVSWPKREIKMSCKKLICEKTMLQKCIFLCYAFLELTKVEIFFKKQDFYVFMKEKITQTDSHEKNCSETRKSMVKTVRFHIKLFMSICTWKNSSQLAQFPFLQELSSRCC